MNFLSLLFGKFWGIVGDIISLNQYHGILKRKNVTKKANNKNFHHSDEFFRIIIKAMVVTLCIQAVGCSTINELQLWIGRSNWPTLIAKVVKNCLSVSTV